MNEIIKQLILEKEENVYKYSLYAIKKMGHSASYVTYWGIKLRNREAYKRKALYQKKYQKEVLSGHVK